MSGEVNLEQIARGTPGYAGADLENLVNEAALNAARYNRDSVTLADFETAKDKVSMGSPRRSMVIPPEERRHTAFHEAGHAIVGRLVPGNDPVHKVTIIPRGPALGVTMTLPEEDRFTLTKDRAESLISFLMGGRVAEEVVFGHLTTGASNDIERATDLARRMVTEWGMSEKLGPVNFGSKNENIFLGREMSAGRSFSEETGRVIDAEVRQIVERNYERAKKVVLDNRQVLDAMAQALLELETIEMDDIDALMKGQSVVGQLPSSHRNDARKQADAARTPSPVAASTSAVIDLSKSVKASS
jgi:cell division protease FtsH